MAGAVGDLVRRSATMVELTLRAVSEDARKDIVGEARVLREVGDELVLEVEGDAALGTAIERAIARGARVTSAVPRRDSLEDLFVRQALVGSSDDARTG